MFPFNTDLEFLFSQHAVSATLHRVTATFDPETLTETTSSTTEPLSVLQLTGMANARAPTQPHNRQQELSFLIDAESLSSTEFSPLDQLEFDDSFYRITQEQSVPDTNLIQVTVLQTQPYNS